MKKIILINARMALLAVFVSVIPAALLAQPEPLVLKLPPAQTNVIAEGMGNAVGADGTLFYATSFNPALLGRAPHTVEGFVFGLNVSNDLFGLIDYVQGLKNSNSIDQDFTNIANGSTTSNATLTNQGLGDLQSFLGHLTNKAVQVGAGANISIKFTKNIGFQIYNSSGAFSQVWPGLLTNTLMGIPLNSNSPAAVGQAVTTLGNDITAVAKANLATSQYNDATFQTDLTNLKNGSESLSTFVTNVSNNPAMAGVDVNALKQAILSRLTDDMGVLTALAYIDTVFMGTYCTQPFPELPGLTLGGNLKIVNRHISYDRFSFTSGSSIGASFSSNLQQSTTRWGFDFGALYELPEFPIDFGLSIQDLFHAGANISASSGSLLSGFTSDPAPTMVNLSASYHPAPGLRVNADVDDLFSSSSLYTGSYGASRIKMGADYVLGGFFDVRTGFGDQNFSVGAGIAAGFFGLNYSYGIDNISQAYNHYAQMSFVF